MSNPEVGLLQTLRQRGLLHQVSDEAALSVHLDSGVGAHAGAGRAVYCGFDPTADSLTIGNLVPIILLRHFQLAGHTPVVVMGGGTGLIGDPSGKTAERQLRTRDEVESNVRSQMRIFGRVLDFSDSTPNRARMVNNADWLTRLSFLDALRDVGKHFSVNVMIQRDSVRERLHNREQGISYTEFSYILLQAYDFLVLFRDHAAHGVRQPVTIQCGGSDQWGNMVAGIELIRRVRAVESARSGGEAESGEPHAPAFCLTAPLVTKADGGKFGKTESGAIWLTPERTSPYNFYQFWLNSADADVVRFLRLFTFLPMAEIDRLEASLQADPGKREAHRTLAREMTRLLHGEEELAKAEAAAGALFGKRTAADDGPFVLPEDLLASAPGSTHDRRLLDGVGVSLVDVLAQTTLAKSKTEARTLLMQNSISVNGRKAAADARLTTASLIPGDLIALRRGSKAWHITRWS